jgi:hypothetical protein
MASKASIDQGDVHRLREIAVLVTDQRLTEADADGQVSKGAEMQTLVTWGGEVMRWSSQYSYAKRFRSASL